MLTDYLRDTMAALKWEIYEKQPITKRKSISENAGEVFRQFFIDQAKGLFGRILFLLHLNHVILLHQRRRLPFIVI